MSGSARANFEVRRGAFTGWFTFIAGVPLGVGALYLIEHGPWQNATFQRYFHHEAEQAVVVLFCCCMAGLLAKLLSSFKERVALARQLLPAWDGKPMPIAAVTQVQQALNLVWDSVKNTYVGRRIANILTFVQNRGSAHGLDDQMRTLSDADAMALDGSYAFLRFMIWAMPILGFLGTVLGITEAIGGISPQQLEQGGAGDVTSGLTKAFDATALALALTLVAMFVNSIVEKMEQGLLEKVDQYVDAELSHRFVHAEAPSSLGHSADVILSVQQLIQSQTALWSASMQKAEERWLQTGPPHQEKLAAAMQQALDAALTRFGQRIVETEKNLLDRQSTAQLGLARLTDALNLSVEMITKTQSSEAQLIRLQESLSQNLVLLANSATFEQAVESLTAAIHLLTTRVNPNPSTGPRLMPMQKDAA